MVLASFYMVVLDALPGSKLDSTPVVDVNYAASGCCPSHQTGQHRCVRLLYSVTPHIYMHTFIKI